MPKSSSDTLKPLFLSCASWCLPASRCFMATVSVSSSAMHCGCKSLSRAMLRIWWGISSASSCPADKFIDITKSFMSYRDCQSCSCCRLFSMTHKPTSFMSPNISSTGTSSAAPRCSGWSAVQRNRHSQPVISRVFRSTIGW